MLESPFKDLVLPQPERQPSTLNLMGLGFRV